MNSEGRLLFDGQLTAWQIDDLLETGWVAAPEMTSILQKALRQIVTQRMSKASEKMIKRQIEMADGRYLIFYIFAPPDGSGRSPRPDATPEAKAAEAAEEN